MIKCKGLVAEPVIRYLQMLQFEIDGIDHARTIARKYYDAASEPIQMLNHMCWEQRTSKGIVMDTIRTQCVPIEYQTDNYEMAVDFETCEVIVSDKVPA